MAEFTHNGMRYEDLGNGKVRVIGPAQPPAIGQPIGGNPLLPGQMQGQGLDNTGKGLSNQRTAQDIALDRAKFALSVKQQFESDQSVKLYKESLPVFAKALTANDGKQGDISVVYSFAKVMDPGSVVREGEIEFANASASLIQRVQQYIGLVKEGKGLPPEVRKGLLREMNATVAEYNKGYSAAYNLYSDQARNAGFNPTEVIGNHFGDAYRSSFDQFRKAHGSKEVRNEDQSAALAAMIRGGASYEDAQKWAQSIGGSLPRAQYDAAVEYARKNPGQANAEVFNKQPLSGFESLANALPVNQQDIGFVHGAKQALDRAALAGQTAVNMIPGVNYNGASEANANSEAMFAGLPGDPTAQTAGRLLGAGALSAPIRGPMTAGAVGNLLMGDSTDPAGMMVDAGIGAIGGKLGDAAVRGVAGLVAPQGRQQFRNLSQQGVESFTPGQLIGPRATNFEDRLTSNPVLGPRIEAMRDAGLTQANRILPNRALGHVGQSLPDNVPAGHEAVDLVHRTGQDFYNNTLAGQQIPIDPTFVKRLNVMGMRANMRPQDINEIGDFLQREVGGAFQEGGTPLGVMSGRGFKALDEKLGDFSAKWGADQDPYKRQMGSFVADTRDQLKALARRQSPEMAQNLRAADNLWADYSIMRRAAAMSPEDGIYGAGQLRNAVRQNDRSASKGATARGQARGQDLAKDMSVLPSKIGTSGTSEREQVNKLTPYVLGALLSPLYSDVGTKALQKALLRQAGPAAQSIADRMRLIPRGMFGAGAPLLIQSGPSY